MEISLSLKNNHKIQHIFLKLLDKINVKDVENIANYLLYAVVKQSLIVHNNVNKEIKDFILKIVNLHNNNN
jgi:hypothetical protein